MSALTSARRMLKSMFGQSIVLFIFIQLTFVTLAKIDYLRETETSGWCAKLFINHIQSAGWFHNVSEVLFKRGMEHAQTAFLLFWVYVLVGVNTYVFSRESARHLASLCDEENLAAIDCTLLKSEYSKSSGLVHISIGISGFLAALIAVSFFGLFGSDNAWASLLEVNEACSVVLFAIFLYTDYKFMALCGTAMQKCPALSATRKGHLTKFQESLRSYLLAVDGPGLIGIVFILVISFLLRPIIAGYYWQGFVAGAIGLHIAFSQTALALLAAFERE